MTSSPVVPCLAGRNQLTLLGLLAIAVVTTPLLPSAASAQPLLPSTALCTTLCSTSRTTLRSATADNVPELVKRRPFGLAPDSASVGVIDPYPGTRRVGDIDRVPEFTADVIGWVALGRVLWSSGYDQFAESPTTWPRDTESYGRRFVTRSAQLVSIEVVRHGIAAALNRDPAYVPCACTGFGARLGHVTKGVVTDFDEDGTRRIGWPRFAGALAGAVVLGQLQPGQGGAGTVAFRTVGTVAGSFLGNAAKEILRSGKSDVIRPQTP